MQLPHFEEKPSQEKHNEEPIEQNPRQEQPVVFIQNLDDGANIKF